MNLHSWGIETLAPKLRELTRSRCGASYHVVPLFPGYLFARFDAAALLAKVRLTRGIQRVVGLGQCATPIDASIIDLIRNRIRDDGLIPWPELQRGDRVEIVDGPLGALVGIFEHYVSARSRVAILLTTIGGHTRVEVACAAVKKAQAAS